MRRRSASSLNRSRTGVILIVVLVLVVMMSLTGFTFMNRMATEYEAAVINGELRQAKQTLASAETFLVLLAEREAGQPEPFGRLHHDQRLFVSRTIKPADKASANIDTLSVSQDFPWQFSVVNQWPDALTEHQNGDEFREFIHRPTIRFGLENESGKLHLGRVLQWEHDTTGAGRNVLMEFPGMTVVAADSILDWIDSDDQPREFGAEQEYYARLNIPYTPRNGVPTSVEELLFVKGVTRAAFYGSRQRQDDESLNGLSWTDLFTVHSTEPNKSRFGRDRINLNNVFPAGHIDDAGEIDTELSFLPQELFKYILLARLYGISRPAAVVDEFSGSAQIRASEAKAFLNELVIPDSDEFVLKEIVSLVDLVDTSVRLPQLAGGNLVVSPLNSESPEFPEIMKELEDRVTVSINERFVGRININTATEPVLRALMGDEGVVARIIEQRKTLDARERESTAWLLTRQMVDYNTYRQIYPHITTRGAVHSGEIVVYRNSGGPFLRRRLVIDASVVPARRVAWLDLTHRGLPVRLSSLVYDDGQLNTGRQPGL
ncbi:MAG: general secretion pathway protein GspK [Fuerstiella sp.]|nr:general secretion pathway protein GspK [Fuerstiella sp.]